MKLTEDATVLQLLILNLQKEKEPKSHNSIRNKTISGCLIKRHFLLWDRFKPQTYRFTNKHETD